MFCDYFIWKYKFIYKFICKFPVYRNEYISVFVIPLTKQ